MEDVRVVGGFVCVKNGVCGSGKIWLFVGLSAWHFECIYIAAAAAATAHVRGRIDSAFSLCTHSHFLPLLSSYMYLSNLTTSAFLCIPAALLSCFILDMFWALFFTPAPSPFISYCHLFLQLLKLWFWGMPDSGEGQHLIYSGHEGRHCVYFKGDKRKFFTWVVEFILLGKCLHHLGPN